MRAAAVNRLQLVSDPAGMTGWDPAHVVLLAASDPTVPAGAPLRTVAKVTPKDSMNPPGLFTLSPVVLPAGRSCLVEGWLCAGPEATVSAFFGIWQNAADGSAAFALVSRTFLPDDYRSWTHVRYTVQVTSTYVYGSQPGEYPEGAIRAYLQTHGPPGDTTPAVTWFVAGMRVTVL